MTTPSRQLAKDVASELERRRRRRRLAFMAIWATLIALAILYLRCGSGWGTGGKGAGKGPGTGTAGSAQTQGPKRCVVRVSSEGITVDGKKSTRDEAVAACKQTEGALVTVTGDARQGDWDDLRTALDGAGVKIFTRGDR
jgi:hypothetical protein